MRKLSERDKQGPIPFNALANKRTVKKSKDEKPHLFCSPTTYKDPSSKLIINLLHMHMQFDSSFCYKNQRLPIRNPQQARYMLYISSVDRKRRRGKEKGNKTSL